MYLSHLEYVPSLLFASMRGKNYFLFRLYIYLLRNTLTILLSLLIFYLFGILYKVECDFFFFLPPLYLQCKLIFKGRFWCIFMVRNMVPGFNLSSICLHQFFCFPIVKLITDCVEKLPRICCGFARKSIPNRQNNIRSSRKKENFIQKIIHEKNKKKKKKQSI